VINFKTLSGKWNRDIEGALTGVVDSSETARAIRGAETDQDYEINAIVNITSGNAAVIVNFTYDEDWKEYYLEVVLDVTNNLVKLDAVIRNADGSEASRQTLASRSLPITAEIDYTLRVASNEISSGVFGVYGYVNGFIVVEAEDLTTNFQKGMCGFECLGSADDYSEFSGIFIQQRHYYVPLDSLINEIRSIAQKDIVGEQGTVQNYYDKLEDYIKAASRFADSQCLKERKFFQKGGLEITEYHDGSGSTPPSGMYEFSEEETAWEQRAGVIFTDQRPILSVTSIHENKAAIGETDDWQQITAFRHFSHGEIMFSSSKIPAVGTKNIRIIYKAGYSQTPTDLAIACTRLIVNLIHKQIADRTATFTSFVRPTAISFAMPDIYTPDIKAIFDSYKSVSFGEM